MLETTKLFKIMILSPPIINNENPSYCKGCGECCKTTPGAYHPEQLLDILTSIANRDPLPTNMIIDRYDLTWFIRPKGQTDIDLGYTDVHDGYSGGRCVNHTDSGCSLTFDQRPFICQSLEPREDKRCRLSIDFNAFVAEWSKYQHYFSKILSRFDQD